MARGMAWLLIGGAALMLVIFPNAATGSSTGASASTISHLSGAEYPLPSDGYLQGTMLALIQGTFHAKLTPSGACAWLDPL